MTSIEAYTTTRTGTAIERAAAWLGLAAAVVLLRLPFRHTAQAVRAARRFGRRPLTPAAAETLVAAVTHVGRHWPLRVACTEQSLGAVLAAAILRRRLIWCLGVRFSPPPVEYHAWAYLPDHGPVGEYMEGGWHHHTALEI